MLPEQDAVVAITANAKDMQAQLNFVWDKLLPAFRASALPEDAEEQKKLSETIGALSIREGYVDVVLTLPGSAKK